MADNRHEEDSPVQVVMNELDELANQWTAIYQSKRGWKCQRNRHRRRLRTPCDIWFFENMGTNIRQGSAQTRNLSEQGIALITRSPVFQGVPIEVRIQPPSAEPTHLGGIVVFCRYTQLGVYEVGVALKAHQRTPIFATDPRGAVAGTQWLQEALRDLRHAAHTGRASRVQSKSKAAAVNTR